MVSAGEYHTVLLRSDGCAVACGSNVDGQTRIPALPSAGVAYTQVSAGGGHTVLLRSDGTAVACGKNGAGQCDIPPLDAQTSYTQVSAGGCHTVLLRSDGQVVTCGMHGGQSELSLFATAMNLSSTQVSAGRCHTVILRSDGHAMACGLNRNTQCNIPPLDVAMSYIQVAAGGYHTVLLRCDGRAVACGKNTHGQCHIPPCDEGTWYTQVSAGNDHTVLLRSDGCAVACGLNVDGQCNIPPLDEGMSYIQVSAGWFHTALLRSDGCVVAFGKGTSRCEIPSLEPGFCYVGDAMPHSRDVVLQLDFLCEFDTFMLTCFSLAGEQVLRLNARCSDLAWSTYKRIACKLNVNLPSLKLVLPDGHLLASICRANPLAIVADLTRQGVAILSGDVWMVELCRELGAKSAVFVTDVDGVFTKPPSEAGAELVPEILLDNKGELELRGVSMNTASHDVTGGLKAKLESAADVLRGAPSVEAVYIVRAGSSAAAEALHGLAPKQGTTLRRR
ncbi:unnamed protein product [Cladocopium goreaui]|uniref:Probable E3 ubiquitin-protein ligase HERC3 (HEC T domain and RCC1-like domain-containing protein 3) (HECT-type E3 ubiquitin transferase HERC3) n=1 Tax=Cladocopium goreaui TaxID=2562237 RepID=A0A9P1G3S7_9DINO|nr:unnamed protein product [Cladocopium goreaui]